VASVIFEGAPGAELQPLVPIEIGAQLHVRDLRDAVRALHATARFSRVAAFGEPLAAPELPAGWTAGVRVVFLVVPVRRLLQVVFTGYRALPESLLNQTASLQTNAGYQPEAVGRAVEAIRAAYHRVGYRAAKVQPVVEDQAAGVRLRIQIDEGEPTRVSEVLFVGDPGLAPEELAAAFKVEPGDVLNLGLLDEGVRGVRERYRLAGRLRARVEAADVDERGPREARVIVPVQAGPPIRFLVRGNRWFSDAVIVSRLGLEGEEQLDAQVAQELAQRLRRFYGQAGFSEARIAWRELRGPDGTVEIVFTVDEGPQLRVVSIDFTGNAAFAAPQLREQILLLLRDSLPIDPAPGADPSDVQRRGAMGRLTPEVPERLRVDPDTVFEPSIYARGLKQIENLYKSQGYLLAQVGPAQLEPLSADPGGDGERRATGSLSHAERRAKSLGVAKGPLRIRPTRVLIPVVEGDRSLVGRLLVEGGGDVPAAELQAALVLRSDGPFSYLATEEGRTALTSVLTRRGYFYAKVEDEEGYQPPRPGDPPGTARVDVRYRIQTGPLVRVALIEVVGQRHTEESLVRELIGISPGALLTPDGLDRAQQALQLTGLFFSATLTPRNPEVAEPEKTLLVQLRERPRRELQGSVGFSLEDGPRTSVQYTQGNLLGRNLTLTAIARANFPYSRLAITCPSAGTAQALGSGAPTCDPIERLLDVGLTIPRLQVLATELRLGFDLLHEHDVRTSYTLNKYSGQVQLANTRARPFHAALAFEVGYQQLTLGSRSLQDILAGVDQRVFVQPAGNMIFGSLRPTVSVDLRDDLARPRAGFYAEASVDLLKSLTLASIDVNLLKLQGLVAGYVPLPFLASAVVSARAGRVFQLDTARTSVVPGDRRLYLGGATTLRGFHQDALQPQDVRDSLQEKVKTCLKTLTSFDHCDDQLQVLAAGGTSDGGLLMLAVSAELRIPIAASIELALFYDAGNLWSCASIDTNNPAPNCVAALSRSGLVLRDAVGSGLRYVTPIGRMAVDVGVNLNPAPELGEPRLGLYFSIDSL
jgi:outer membrane protein assembly factor BamA